MEHLLLVVSFGHGFSWLILLLGTYAYLNLEDWLSSSSEGFRSWIRIQILIQSNGFLYTLSALYQTYVVSYY